MNNVLEDSLFVSQNRKFDEIQSIVRQFSAEYVGNSIIKDNIFAVIQNYARKKEIALELLRYPIHDDELWALTFLKQDTIFVCVNTALPLCKQFFAAAHELYHIYCYVENGATNFEDVRCISLVSVFSRLKEESNWTLADAEPYIESLIAFYQDHHQTTFRVMEASEVRRLQRIPCRQVLQEIFDGKFIELKNGMLRYKQ